MSRTLNTILVWFALGIPLCTGNAQTSESRTFAVSRGDALVVRNDLGEVVVQGVEGSQVRVRSSSERPQDSRKDQFIWVAEKQRNTIRVESVSTVGLASPMQLTIEVPNWLDVIVWGIQPKVSLKDLRGRVRVQLRAGSIQAQNINGAVSLLTDSGSIEYQVAVQPLDDVHLNSWAGEVRCQLSPSLNLRALLRSGSRITWATEVDTRQTSLERALGVAGPFLYASSREGPVAVTLDSPTPPAQPGEAVAAADEVIKIDSSWVYLNVSVKEPLSGVSLTGLNKDDFLVYEDGASQSLDHFESAESPFHLLLLLDMSESTRDRLGLIKSAAAEFIQKTRPSDQVAVATFNTTVRLTQGFTRVREQALQALRNVAPGGGTALYDALLTTVTEYLAGIEGRKAVIVFTDGVDNQLFGNPAVGSQHSFDDLLRQVKAADCLIYSIFLMPDYQRVSGVNSGSQRNPFSVVDQLSEITNRRAEPSVRAAQEILLKAESHLRAIADQTGGRMYAPRRVEDLAQVYGQVASELRTQYTIGYRPSAGTKGQWRVLKVRVREHPLATVRTRAGYYHPGN